MDTSHEIDSSDIDDEKHFLFPCFHLSEERKKLYDEINICCNNFSQLNPTDKLIWLMAVGNPDLLTRISNNHIIFSSLRLNGNMEKESVFRHLYQMNHT
jgi:hypothetical protein